MIKMTKTERRKEALFAHYAKLRRLALLCGINTPDGKKLSVALWKLEKEAHKLAEDYSNGLLESDQWELETDKIAGKVQELFNNKLKGFFVNGDPRGYALKINDDVMRDTPYSNIGLDRDWGGYGLLSPEIGE